MCGGPAGALSEVNSYQGSRMASEGISPKDFSTTLNRLEQKLESIINWFEDLDKTAEKLKLQLEQHKQALARQAHQDRVWLSLLEYRLNTVETNLFHTYVVDTLRCCHADVLKRLPDLAHGLPTFTSVLRRKIKNHRISVAWESTLRSLGLEHSDIKALCAFFMTHGHQAEYYGPAQRQQYTQDFKTLMQKLEPNPTLRESLLRLVQVVEKGRVCSIPLPQTPL